jgi:predicted phosphodiesterase
VIIGVISDTHGNMKLAHAAADRIRGVEKADLLLHLGDNYPDAEELGVAGHPIRMVPGLWCAQYRDHRVPKTIVDTLMASAFAMLHADQDLGPRERAAALIMSGHTHVAKIEPSGKHVYMNPGHLKSMIDRGQRPPTPLSRPTRTRSASASRNSTAPPACAHLRARSAGLSRKLEAA